MSEAKLEGGPYNGNHYPIPDDSDIFEIASHSESLSTVHVYRRVNERLFQYDLALSARPVPYIGDTGFEVELDQSTSESTSK